VQEAQLHDDKEQEDHDGKARAQQILSLLQETHEAQRREMINDKIPYPDNLRGRDLDFFV
jgi:hypothetical protein